MSGSDFFNRKGIDANKIAAPDNDTEPATDAVGEEGRVQLLVQKALSQMASTLVDVDLLMPELRTLFASQPSLGPVLDRLAGASAGLIRAGSRVGTLYAKVTSEGFLEISFKSRYRITGPR